MNRQSLSALAENPPSSAISLASFLVVLVLYGVYDYWTHRKLPPGPPRLPLIGNLHQAPKEQPWLKYQQWHKKYGPIFRLRYGKDILIMISDYNIARDLLDKRGNIYSDRPRMVMAGENLTKGMHMLFRRYDDRYRLHQRMEAPVLSPRASKSYESLQDLESKQLLYKLLHGNNFQEYFELFSASLIYSLCYGHRVVDRNDSTLLDAHTVQENMNQMATSGAWLVDSLPLLNHLPSFLAPWKRTASRLFTLESQMHLHNLRHGLSRPFWTWSKALSNSNSATSSTPSIPPLELAYSLGILSNAGLDTTAITLSIFILALLSNPSVLPLAHSELDTVVGRARLPTLTDRPSLPYTSAIVTETLRWRPIAHSGVPHATTQEDYYGGYRIPKGAVVCGSHWSINHDETVFAPDPGAFRPERWLQNPDAGMIAFGFGRRVCAGRHIARNSLFLVIARILWAFDVRAAVDPVDGREKQVDDMAFVDGLTFKPQGFEAVFEVRDQETKGVVLREWEAGEKDVGVLLEGVGEERVGRKA
ncbi:MAG: hypothetical protein Q9160_000214 [Pyrenula sp. 1 TL-2023]